MDEARLKQLTERAEKAKAVAAEIKALVDADPKQYGAQFEMHYPRIGGKIGDRTYVNTDLLKKVLIAGRDAVIAEMDRELEALLNGEQQQQSLDGRDRCPKCNRVFAEPEDFAFADRLDGLCPTRVRPDATVSCNKIAAGRIPFTADQKYVVELDGAVLGGNNDMKNHDRSGQ